ncbi:MAG: class I tRNA ligase family protein, partial [Cephaloticoccus sp.]
IRFEVEGDEPLTVFTTRPDTLFGATYMVVAPEHPLVQRAVERGGNAALAEYAAWAKNRSDVDRQESKKKTGVATGLHAVNPATGARIPVWAADYVLMGYGTGAIMAVPAHDERDFEFAQKFDLPIPQVIAPADGSAVELPFCDKTGEVRLINSGDCDGLTPAEAKARLDEQFATAGRGRSTVQFKLRDWLFSRQRYWGEPFPIVWVSETDYRTATAAGNLPVPDEPATAAIDGETKYALPLPESALPLQLPEVNSYDPTGSGESPLAGITEWLEIWHEPGTVADVPATEPPPAAHWIRARRETNTMPQWAGSCWYYLRYVDPRNAEAIASPEALAYWGTPDIYVGGAEHAVLHLLYARFWHKVLFDLGVVPTSEPFTKLFHQGIILGEDGEKMSKSRGNVANPDDVIQKYGADALRLYLMFLGPLDAMKPWNPRGIEGVFRFLQKIWRECVDAEGQPHPKLRADAVESEDLLHTLHETIRKVGDDIAALRYNTAVSQMMICANALQKAESVTPRSMKQFLQVLAPFAPHFCEELWARLGESGSIGTAPWPTYEPKWLQSDECKLVFQVNGKYRGDQLLPNGISQEDAVQAATSHPKVAPHLDGKAIRRVIFVPGKILNLVVG